MNALAKCPKCKRLSDPAAASCDCGYSFADRSFTPPTIKPDQEPLGGWRFLSLLVGAALGSIAFSAKAGGLVAGLAMLAGYHLADFSITQPLRRAKIPMPTRALVIAGVIFGIGLLWVAGIALVHLLVRGGP